MDRIEQKKVIIDTKKHRKLKKYSDNFNRMFNFFLKSYRSGILDFCGSNVNVEFDINSEDSKFTFRLFENGEIKIHNLKTKHPNILKGVIIGKKSWGLFLQEWSDGIVEGSFTKHEILKQFEDFNIEIPESLLKDFNNVIYKKITR